jgi:magnesium chelatase family protein
MITCFPFTVNRKKEILQLDADCQTLIKTALDKMQLSARTYDKIRKVACTIADLAQSENIRPQHLAEAIQYRTASTGILIDNIRS